MKQPLFESFFMAGFECSCHRTRSGRRLDLLEATCHPQHAQADFQRLRKQGITTVRSGIRWHLIETKPYRYDFTSVLPVLRAAQRTGMQMIWDLCHYGWPDDLDIFSAQTVRRFARFAAAFASFLTSESGEWPLLTPINEISYFSWAAGEVGKMYPYARQRGFELKQQLVRAAIAGIDAIWERAPEARILFVEPAINVVPHPQRPQDRQDAEGYSLAQYQAWDMLSGRLCPELGGDERYLNILGVNYYDHNQWIKNGATLRPDHQLYKPFSQILVEVYERYRRPLFISETSTEGEDRPGWLRYIGVEMLEKETLDALYICVPPSAHGELEFAAIEHDLPFFVEKPLATDWQTAATIAQRVVEQDLITAVGYHWRYLNTTEEAQRLLQGQPARLALGYWLDFTPPPAWWTRQEQSGGQMVEQTTHIFDLARVLVGEVYEVYAVGGHLQCPNLPDADVYDATAVTLRFAGGAVGTMASTCLLNWPHRIGLHLFCEGMAIELSEFEIMIDVGKGRPVRRAGGDPFVLEDRAFIDAVQGKPNRIRAPYAEALKTHRLTTAAEQSAREGRVIQMATLHDVLQKEQLNG